MFEKIVIPLDGSALAEAALPAAREIQQKFGSRLFLVRAIDSVAHLMAQQARLYENPGGAAANVDLITAAVSAEEKEAREYLTSIAGQLAATSSEVIVKEGNAKVIIVETVQDQGAGLVVMSSHGRGGLGRLVYGSVADAVLQECTVPVLLIRSKEEHEKR